MADQSTPTEALAPPADAKRPLRDRTHFLYMAVIGAAVLGIVVGLVAPEVGKSLAPLGAGFVKLIRMMISPIIFCTIVLGVGSVRQAAKVGKVGLLALVYFVVMSTIALAIGLVVGNVIKPGHNLHLTDQLAGAGAKAAGTAHTTTADFLQGVIPETLFSSLISGQVLQTLLVALLVGFAVQALGDAGTPILRGITHLQRLVFRVMAIVMWAAPVGAFGAMAAVVGATGTKGLGELAWFMGGFYVTCALFVFVVLGTLYRLVTGLSLFKLLRYLGREFLLIASTSSSETALPRLIAKMEHFGVSRSVVGVTVPTGYSFNLDGTAIYLTLASLFVGEVMGKPLAIGEQISLLVFMMIASKGAAGITGAGLATLASGLQSHRPDLVDGVGIIVGIDRFMSEARAVTNFAGNAAATVMLGTWIKEFDHDQARRVMSGQDPFDETTMIDDHEDPSGEPVTQPQPALVGQPSVAVQPTATV